MSSFLDINSPPPHSKALFGRFAMSQGRHRMHQLVPGLDEARSAARSAVTRPDRNLVERLALTMLLLALFPATSAAQGFDPPDPPVEPVVVEVTDPPGLELIALPPIEPIISDPPEGTAP